LLLDHQNRLWIGTDMGLSRYLPETQPAGTNLVAPKLALAAVKYPKGLKDLTRPQTFLNEENTLTFLFDCISFLNEKTITIRYKLNGFDTEWTEKNNINTNAITYGNLPAGEYTLSIQAKNDIGVWSPIITSPQIKIQAAFVETIWFYLLFAMIVGLFGYGLKNYLTEKRYSAELEIREKERAFLLNQSKNRLRNQYATLLKFASQNPTHDTSMSDIFQEIAEAAANTLDAERTGMWFFDAANSILICSEQYDRLQNEHTTGDHIARKNAEPYFSNIQNDKIVAIADIKTNSFFTKIPVYFKKNGTLSLLTVPIRFKGQIMGALTFEHIGMPRHWTIDEQNFANSIATHISLLQAAQEQARAELRLKNDRNMLYSLIDILPDEIFVKDKNLRFLIINDTLLKKFKAQNYRDIIGKTDHDLIPKRFADIYRSKELKILANGTGFYNELTIKSQKQRYFLTTKIPFRNKAGKISGIVGITQDITQLKRTELSIRENEAKFRNIFKESPIGIVLLNRDGLVVDANLASLSMLGIRNKTQLFGYNFLQSRLFSTEIRDMIKNHKEIGFEKEIDFNSTLKKKYPQITRNGKGCFRLVVTPIKSAPHQPSAPHFLAQVLDITAQKEADKRIQNSLKEKETLLLEVHHRVKNNLQIISSLLDMSAMRIKDKKAIELFTDARAKIHTMALIHSQLYKNERFDRIEMGLHLQELGGFLAMIYSHGQDIQFKIDAPGIYLSLTQAIPCTLVLNELISNAYKHAFESNSKGLIRVTMRINPSNTKMFLSVQDNGSRLQGDLDLFNSSSLGLKLVRNIVQKQLHGNLKSRHENGLKIDIEFEIQ
ncbi:PAS domain S-box protein, partial [bacterium]|nr:PAS domain S-box protein [bacterium]